MESKSLDAIKEQLHKERSLLEVKAEKLRTELSYLDDDLSRIDAAVAALDGAELSATTGKVKKKPKEKSSTKHLAASKADVIKHVRSILEQEGVVEGEALKTLVEERITQAGFTRMGLSLRFKEALGDSQFVDTPAGVRIKDEKLATVKA